MGDFSMNRSNRMRLSRHLQGQDIVLRGVTALKYMELYVEDHFTFDIETERIAIYSKVARDEENFDVKLVGDFSHLDYSDECVVPCSTLSQVVKDMLSEPESMEQGALVESLANYYEEAGHFKELTVEDHQIEAFQKLEKLAMSFY